MKRILAYIILILAMILSYLMYVVLTGYEGIDEWCMENPYRSEVCNEYRISVDK